jgi:hypothetical protein
MVMTDEQLKMITDLAGRVDALEMMVDSMFRHSVSNDMLTARHDDELATLREQFETHIHRGVAGLTRGPVVAKTFSTPRDDAAQGEELNWAQVKDRHPEAYRQIVDWATEVALYKAKQQHALATAPEDVRRLVKAAEGVLSDIDNGARYRELRAALIPFLTPTADAEGSGKRETVMDEISEMLDVPEIDESLVDLMMERAGVESRGAARRLIGQGGVKIEGDILHVGKRTYPIPTADAEGEEDK